MYGEIRHRLLRVNLPLFVVQLILQSRDLPPELNLHKKYHHNCIDDEHVLMLQGVRSCQQYQNEMVQKCEVVHWGKGEA